MEEKKCGCGAKLCSGCGGCAACGTCKCD